MSDITTTDLGGGRDAIVEIAMHSPYRATVEDIDEIAGIVAEASPSDVSNFVLKELAKRHPKRLF